MSRKNSHSSLEHQPKTHPTPANEGQKDIRLTAPENKVEAPSDLSKEDKINELNTYKTKPNLSLLLTPEKADTVENTTQGSDQKQVFQLPSPQQPIGCGCSKSNCLKLYCNCFAKGTLCSPFCNCSGCHNSSDNLARSDAIMEIIKHDPLAFSKRMIVQITGKSGCSKKYCECFRRGRRCVQKCTCFDCKNMKEGHLKTEERVLEEHETFKKTFDLLKKKIKLPSARSQYLE